jgi:hypothetical protein
LVVFQHGFGLAQRGAGKEGDADPVVDEAAGDGNPVTIGEGVKLLEVEVAAAEFSINGGALPVGVTLEIEEVAGLAVGVHAGLGGGAVEMEGGKSFGFGFIGERQNGKEGKRDYQEGAVEGAKSGAKHGSCSRTSGKLDEPKGKELEAFFGFGRSGRGSVRGTPPPGLFS